MVFTTLAYRTIIMFAIILVTMRILGKRQTGQLELNELVAAIMLSELAVSPITNPDHTLLHGIIPIAVLMGGELIISYTCMKSVRLRRFIMGRPSVVIQNGQINQNEMRRNRITLTELTEQMRTHGVTDISTVKYGILEINGTLSLLPYAAHSPATHAAHQLETKDNGLPVIVVSDGRVLDENLKLLGLERRWLDKELKKRGAKDHKQVYLFSVDENRNVFFATKST